VTLLCSKKIPKQWNIKVHLAHKLLPVGNGPNGDAFVIDFSIEACPVGFVTHEEYHGKGNPRPFSEQPPVLLRAFYIVSQKDATFPVTTMRLVTLTTSFATKPHTNNFHHIGRS
jgi:hypothetical protein